MTEQKPQAPGARREDFPGQIDTLKAIQYLIRELIAAKALEVSKPEYQLMLMQLKALSLSYDKGLETILMNKPISPIRLNANGELIDV